MEQSARSLRIIVGLIDKQRRLADSHDLLERASTLWVAGELDKRLSRCTDHEIGQLIHKAQERISVFDPEFAVVEHARRKLVHSEQLSFLPEENGWTVIRDEGVHVLNAETALYRGRVPHLLLPFQKNRFESDVFMVPDFAEAKHCLLTARFKRHPEFETVFVDSQNGQPVRLLGER